MSNLLVRDSTGISRELKASGTGTTLDPIIPEQNINETGLLKTFFMRNVDSVGDASGTVETAINGTTPVTFKFSPTASEIARIKKITLAITSPVFIVNGYASLAALSNGIVINKSLAGTVSLISNIKTTLDLLSISSKTAHNSFGANDYYKVDIILPQPLRLDGSVLDHLQIIINDDLTGLTSQLISVQGYYE